MCRPYLRPTEWISGRINNCRNQTADEMVMHWCRQTCVGGSAHWKELLNTSLNAGFSRSRKTKTTPIWRPRQSVRPSSILSLSLSLLHCTGDQIISLIFMKFESGFFTERHPATVNTAKSAQWQSYFTVKGKVHHCTGRTAHRGSTGIALLFLDHGTRRGWVSVTPRPLFIPEKDPVPIVQEDGWAPGPVWTGAENLAPTGIESSDCPARCQSLYRLR